MAKEIRVTFTDKEIDLYNFIDSKSSKTAFLKDLAQLEKERQEKLINSGDVDYETLAAILASKLGNTDIITNSNKDIEEDQEEDQVEEPEEDQAEEPDDETIINNIDVSDLDF